MNEVSVSSKNERDGSVNSQLDKPSNSALLDNGKLLFLSYELNRICAIPFFLVQSNLQNSSIFV